MIIRQYYTYFDEYKTHLTKSECELKISNIFSSYNKETVLGFLGHVAKELTFDNSIENSDKVQKDLIGLSIETAPIIHRRAHLGLVQMFCSMREFSNSIRTIIEPRDVFHLYILMNELLNIVEYSEHDQGSFLHASFLISHSLLSTNDLVASYHMFSKFYEKLITHKNSSDFNDVLKSYTGYDLEFFKNLIDSFSKRKLPNNIFNILSKFSVLEFEKIFDMWVSRNPS